MLFLRIYLARRALLASLALASGALLVPAADAAEKWPAKPIQLVIPYPPGGSADLLGRPLAYQLQRQLGQSVVLEYKPGAGGTLASQYVARAKPDGYTVLMVLAAHAINDSLYPKLPYDTRRDFAPVSLVATLPMIVVASGKLQSRSLPELIQAARMAPGKLTFGSAGNGNTGHLAAEYFSSLAGVKMTHVPYKGSAPAMNDLLGGQVQLMFSDAPTALQHIKSSRIKVLGVASRQRSPMLPAVPTVAESGLPGYEAYSWAALFAPARTPRPVLDKLNVDFNTAMTDPGVRRRLLDAGAEAAPGTQEQMRQSLRAELVKWGKVIKTAGITAG